MRLLLICGAPGSGKTTLAGPLSAKLGARLITSGDIARRVDPGGVANGSLANEVLFRLDFNAAIREAAKPPTTEWIVIDGFPRSRIQMTYLDGWDARFIVLTCRPSTAIERQLHRGRPGDGDLALIEKRTHEQIDLLDLNSTSGWLYQRAGRRNVINTNSFAPGAVLEMAYEITRT